MKLTPREPTPEMVKAAIDRWFTSFADIWRAMHDAAPSAEPVSGWSFTLEGDTARIASPLNGPGVIVVSEQSQGHAQRMLFALAAAIARAKGE